MPTTAADAYPEARFDRAPYVGKPSPPPSRVLTPPRSRFFNVECGAGASSRGTVSTPKIIGPAVLQSLKIRIRTATDPPGFSWELGWATFPVTEFNVALTTSKPWNALVERLRHAYETPQPNLVGLVEANSPAGVTNPFLTLDAPLLITAPEFYLTFCAINTTAAVNPFAAYVEFAILENLAPEVAANFH